MNKTIEVIKKYLALYNSNSAERFILERGVEMIWRPLPPSVIQGIPNYCYHQAYHLAAETGLIYCEGVGFGKGRFIPMLHAWCQDKDGYVVDPTWQVQSPNEIPIYLGVGFKRSFVKKIKNKTLRGKKCYGESIIDDSGKCRLIGIADSEWQHSKTEDRPRE